MRLTNNTSTESASSCNAIDATPTVGEGGQQSRKQELHYAYTSNRDDLDHHQIRNELDDMISDVDAIFS